ncbi:hypothetical protein DUNSADRAFT_11673 [Dunaliella salina]|uniref:PAS domain-containing protein n=1 Tax=Dunaliella salina TaxID=3046 RepID=A0ABQ7GCU6_DUNSA|nr:hypothetical protein DUNSADRAFT_11673 [Dunaliella salina]|eukprot:KAF5832427.1 hypothetical protein DUNSADRAFT_11673 [Dunaliella salina]
MIGLAHFPEHPKMVITHANFVVSVQQNYQMGPSLLQFCSKLEGATPVDHYITFSMEQEQKARAKTQASGGVAFNDLVGYVEFQTNFRKLARAYRSSLMTLKAFWKLLLHEDISFKRLLDGFAKIEESAKKTDKIFKVLLERYPGDENLYRMYARFLEHVRSDPWTANKFTLTADKMDEEDKSGGSALAQQHEVGSSVGNVNEKTQAVIVIDAAGIMLVANKQAQKLFGYKKTEMEGKNVSMLMPQPFSSRHNGYLRTHINSGKKRILDIVRPVVGLHKNRTVFPMNLGVTKVSGVGGDSVFMGAMRPSIAPPGVIRVWCMMTGSVVSVDDSFCESFGKTYKDVAGRPFQSLTPSFFQILFQFFPSFQFPPKSSPLCSGFGKTYKDVAGCPFQSLTRDPDVILKLLDRAAVASESDFAEGKVQQKGVFVLHNYMDPVEVCMPGFPQPLDCTSCSAFLHFKEGEGITMQAVKALPPSIVE